MIEGQCERPRWNANRRQLLDPLSLMNRNAFRERTPGNAPRSGDSGVDHTCKIGSDEVTCTPCDQVVGHHGRRRDQGDVTHAACDRIFELMNRERSDLDQWASGALHGVCDCRQIEWAGCVYEKIGVANVAIHVVAVDLDNVHGESAERDEHSTDAAGIVRHFDPEAVQVHGQALSIHSADGHHRLWRRDVNDGLPIRDVWMHSSMGDTRADRSAWARPGL